MQNTEIKKLQKQNNILWIIITQLMLRIERLTKKVPLHFQLYQQAHLMIGRDASPLDFVTDDLGCAESVSQIIKKVVPFRIITGTWTLWDVLRTDKRFKQTGDIAEVGTIILSATGSGNGTMRGHVGIVGKNNVVMSADSMTGLWQTKYTLQSWNEWYNKKGAMPTRYFKLI